MKIVNKPIRRFNPELAFRLNGEFCDICIRDEKSKRHNLLSQPEAIEHSTSLEPFPVYISGTGLGFVSSSMPFPLQLAPEFPRQMPGRPKLKKDHNDII